MNSEMKVIKILEGNIVHVLQLTERIPILPTEKQRPRNSVWSEILSKTVVINNEKMCFPKFRRIFQQLRKVSKWINYQERMYYMVTMQ